MRAGLDGQVYGPAHHPGNVRDWFRSSYDLAFPAAEVLLALRPASGRCGINPYTVGISLPKAMMSGRKSYRFDGSAALSTMLTCARRCIGDYATYHLYGFSDTFNGHVER